MEKHKSVKHEPVIEVKQMKYCKDCRWYQGSGTRGKLECDNEKASETKEDMVLGEVSVKVLDADPAKLRADHKYCGPSAKWFENKLF